MEHHNKETIFIPNGIIAPEISSSHEIKVRWNLKKDSYFLFVGRLVPEKGCHYLIKAFRKLKTDKMLIIAGGQSHSEDYVKQIHKLAEGDKRIIFTGYVYGKTLDELYSNAYVYIHPSDLEGLPITLLEALSYGNCVIASDISENAEVVAPNGKEEYGVMFSKGNTEDLLSKMQHLLTHPMLVKETESLCKDYVIKSFSWDDVTSRTLEVYNQVLNG